MLLGQREAEAVEGGGVEGAHAVAGCGLGQLAGDARGELIRRGGDGHACLAGGVAVAEQAPDGEGEAAVLDAHEKRSAVGGEGWAGELRVVLDVAGEPVDVAPGSYAYDTVVVVPAYGLGLGEPEVAPGSKGYVVRALGLPGVVALAEELEDVRLGEGAEDLA